MSALLLEAVRTEGVAMGSLYVGKHMGFTTDERLVARCRDLGATISPCYNATGPRGWEISFVVGSPIATGGAA